MKKLLIVGALALVGSVGAQTFGIKAGLNVATIGNADKFAENLGGSEATSKIGFNAGVFMNAPLTTELSIQPELLYSTKGTTIKAGSEELKLNLDYINVPVMFQYHLAPGFYVEAGPEFGFNVGANFKIDDDEQDIKDDMNSFDFGLGLGLGYRITPMLGINARYSAGFIDIAKDNESDTKYTNNVFQVGLSYAF